MIEVQPFRLQPAALRLAASLVALLAAACTFDFEAPFAGGGDGGAGGASSTVTTPTTSSTTTTASGEGGESPVASVSVTVTSSGASTSSSSSTSTSSSSSSATSSSSGQPLEEDCGNGVDDDGDDDIDCEDSTCEAAGYGCELAAPDGFEGPVALVRGAPNVPPSCGGSFPQELIAGGIGELTANAPTCTLCSCESPVGATCSTTLRWTSDSLCALETGSMAIADSGCVNVVDVSSIDAVFVDTPIAAGGDCAEVGGVATLPPARYDETAKLCGAPLGAGCEDGDVCLRPAESPFDERLCVYKEGDSSCAGAEPFTDLVEIHQDVDDQRRCTDCVCGAPTGIDCSGTTEIFTNNQNCSGQSFAVDHDGGCTQGGEIRSIDTDLTASGGSCSATGGAPTGTAFPIGPVTVCCLL